MKVAGLAYLPCSLGIPRRKIVEFLGDRAMFQNRLDTIVFQREALSKSYGNLYSETRRAGLRLDIWI